MRKVVFVFIISIFSIWSSMSAQKYITKVGEINVYSTTSLFKLHGTNNKVASIIDFQNGEFLVSTLIRSFRFDQAVIEENFSEYYLEPNKYPNAVFKGRIIDFDKFNLSNNGYYYITIVGKLTIHGKTNDISEAGLLIVKNGNLTVKAEFNLSLEKYEILVHEMYYNFIEDNLLFTVQFDYVPY